MAIILYPTEDYNSFIEVATLKTFISENVPSAQNKITDISDSDLEIYIKQATRLIKSKITLPDTLEDDLQYATSYLVNYSIGVDMLNTDDNSNIKSISIDSGTIEKEFFSQSKSVNSFPPIVESLLSSYNYSASGSFKFGRA